MTVTCERLGSGEVSCMGTATSGGRSDHVHVADVWLPPPGIVSEVPVPPPASPIHDGRISGEALVGTACVVIVALLAAMIVSWARESRR